MEILLAGQVGIAESPLRSCPPSAQFLRWAPLDDGGDIYQQAHVFALPTISDGFAITQLEAMAHGLPVVVTPNCGRVVTDGVDGLIVPARESQALAETLSRLNRNRSLIREMSRNALLTVKKYNLSSNAMRTCELTALHHAEWLEKRNCV